MENTNSHTDTKTKRKKAQSYIISILFICLMLSIAKNVFFYMEKDMLENAHIETAKALSLHKDFITDIQSYTSTMYNKDIALQNTFNVFIDFMQDYGTHKQKGRSSKFMKEINATLSQEISIKEAQKEAERQEKMQEQEAQEQELQEIHSQTQDFI